jgi:hypothetical protein
MKYDTQKIIAALQSGIAEADAVDAFHGEEDGGTCNFDSAYLRVPGMRKAQAETIMAAFPRYKVVLQDYQWHGRILMLLHNRGQGNRRTRMADAAYRAFQQAGLPCGQYLQMD